MSTHRQISEEKVGISTDSSKEHKYSDFGGSDQELRVAVKAQALLVMDWLDKFGASLDMSGISNDNN